MKFNFTPCVLIVGNNADNYLSLRKTLQKAGFGGIDFAPNLVQIKIALSKQNYHGLLLDINSQDIDFTDILSNLMADNFFIRIGFLGSDNNYQNDTLIKHAQDLGFELLDSLAINLSLEQAYKLRADLDFPAHLANHIFSADYIKESLLNGKICSWFQPQLNLKSNKISSTEALVRWQINADTVLMPSSFLPSLVAQNLVYDLLLRSLEDALNAHKIWRKLGFKIKCAINLPPHLLLHDDLADTLNAKVVKTGINPQYITFEVLENPAISDALMYKKTAYLLRSYGFGLSQDDHGRGFDSLYSLLQLPFTELKLDRSFVSGAWSNKKLAIAVKRVSDLGRDLNLTITAEGIENIQDFSFMHSTNCDFIQGFFIAKAINPQHFGQLLNSFN